MLGRWGSIEEICFSKATGTFCGFLKGSIGLGRSASSVRGYALLFFKKFRISAFVCYFQMLSFPFQEIKRTGKVWFNKINILWARRPLLTKDLESTVKDGKDGLKEAKHSESKDKKSICCCVSLHLLLRCSISSVCMCVLNDEFVGCLQTHLWVGSGQVAA